ncbi:MAG TPA: hypothetical protein PKZ84_03560 [Anaerolineae bacterium]|nr:hypothetical protein [Anaerolineae bacterium]HQI84485.1 hypothetical protein [Anaerolineae bacterium]
MKLARFSQKIGLLLVLAITSGFFIPQPGLTQTTAQEQYFAETGHWVRGEFLTYFHTRGGLAIFGYPISERFIDQGLTVQYFQKARMELHPENQEPYRVQLGLLGEELKYRQPAIPAPQSLSRRKVYFPETGHTVSYAFLDFFKTNGGVDIFGYPITEMHFEEGQIVQYFQRLKMQWQPNDPATTVVIGNLGEVYISIYGNRMPSEALRATSGDAIIQTSPPLAEVSGIRAVVSLRYSVMSKKRNQTISVLVTDNNGDPRPDAQVAISFIETPSNVVLASNIPVLVTDKQGFAQISVPINEGRSGAQIVVRATVTYGSFTTTAQNVFLLWW